MRCQDCKKLQENYGVFQFCEKHRAGMTAKKEEILRRISLAKIQDVAKKMGCSFQYVSQVKLKAEEEGLVDFKEITKRRKQDAIKIADLYHPFKGIGVSRSRIHNITRSYP